MELYRDEKMVVHTPASQDSTILKIELVGPMLRGSLVVNQLIEQSPVSLGEDASEDFDFAGRHIGMPKNHVWAMSRHAENMSEHLDFVVAYISRVIGENPQS